MTTLLITMILAAAGAAVLKSRVDLYLIAKSKDIKQTQNFIHSIELIILLIFGSCLSVFASNQIYTQLVDVYFSYIINMIIMSLSFWALFDPLMAIGLGKNWDYVGDTSNIDTLKVPLGVKLLSLVMFIGFYYSL